MSALPQYLGIGGTVGVSVATFHKLMTTCGDNPQCPECQGKNALQWSGPRVYTCRDCQVVVVVVTRTCFNLGHDSDCDGAAGDCQKGGAR